MRLLAGILLLIQSKFCWCNPIRSGPVQSGLVQFGPVQSNDKKSRDSKRKKTNRAKTRLQDLSKTLLRFRDPAKIFPRPKFFKVPFATPHKAWKNVHTRATIGFVFTSDWLKKWRKNFEPITA